LQNDHPMMRLVMAFNRLCFGYVYKGGNRRGVLVDSQNKRPSFAEWPLQCLFFEAVDRSIKSFQIIYKCIHA
jgi:hypothetical protein